MKPNANYVQSRKKSQYCVILEEEEEERERERERERDLNFKGFYPLRQLPSTIPKFRVSRAGGGVISFE